MMAFTIHTRTDLPKRAGSAAGIAYVIRLDGKVVYDSAPDLFTTKAKALNAAKRHLSCDSHKLGQSPSDFVTIGGN